MPEVAHRSAKRREQRNRMTTESDALVMAVFLFNKTRFAIYDIYHEMAVQRWVDRCCLDLFDENMSRGEVEPVTDA